eukprot:294709_1
MAYPTRLEQLECGNCEDAPALLGVRRVTGGVQRVPVVFTPIRGACSCSIVIPKGFVALVNRHGRYVGQWGAGFKWAPPWVTVSHLVPTQFIVYDTPVKECPTQDNVMVTIDVTLVLRILVEEEKSCYNFCYKLGPRGLDEMLKAFQEESIRGMARKRKYNEIYDLMDSQQDKQLDSQRRELNDHFSQFGVSITDISVTNVHLPQEFANNMQEATVWHNRNMFKTLQQEYDLRKIEVREAEAKEKQKLKEDLEKFTAEKDKDVADMRRKNNIVDAETAKQLSVIKETEKADVLEIRSNSELTVAKLNSQRDVRLANIKASGTAEAEKIRIESDTYVQTKRADAEAKIATNSATSLGLTSGAEAFAAKQLVAKRKYEAKMRSLQSLRALAHNKSLAITGNSKDNIMAQLLANQQGGAVLGINGNF